MHDLGPGYAAQFVKAELRDGYFKRLENGAVHHSSRRQLHSACAHLPNRHPGEGRGPGSVQHAVRWRQVAAKPVPHGLATPGSSASVVCGETILDAGLRRHDGGERHRRPASFGRAKSRSGPIRACQPGRCRLGITDQGPGRARPIVLRKETGRSPTAQAFRFSSAGRGGVCARPRMKPRRS